MATWPWEKILTYIGLMVVPFGAAWLGGRLTANAAERVFRLQSAEEVARQSRADRRVSKAVRWRLVSELHRVLIDLNTLVVSLEPHYRQHPQHEIEAVARHVEPLISLQAVLHVLRDEPLEDAFGDWLYDLQLAVDHVSESHLGEVMVYAEGEPLPPPSAERAERRMQFATLVTRGNAIFEDIRQAPKLSDPTKPHGGMVSS